MFFWGFKGFFNKHGCKFDDVNEIATLALLKIKISWNKDHDVIILLHGITNKILMRESHHIVDLVMRRKFGNSSISVKEVIITSVL